MPFHHKIYPIYTLNLFTNYTIKSLESRFTRCQKNYSQNQLSRVTKRSYDVPHSPPHNHSLIRLTGLDAPLNPTTELIIAMSSSWLLVLLSSTTHNTFRCQYIISTTSATIINHSNCPPTTFHHRLLIVGVKDIKLNLSLRSKFLSHSKFIVPRLI